MTTVHLLVLIHGMWGNPGHLSELKRIVEEKHTLPAEDGTTLEVMLPETNRDASTYDGVDWGGERITKEVLAKVKDLQDSGKEVTKFSVTGYSLGGLLARYVVGILHQQGFFEKVTPVNFNTIATPHIGLLKYPSWISSVFSKLGPKLLSRTGEQFYCVDKWSPNGRPLLVVMADPDRIFYQALTKFQHLRIYANAVEDITVPYVTAAIELEDPFAEHEKNGIEIHLHEDYKHVIQSYVVPDSANPPPQKPEPKRYSREWFESVKPRPPRLPPPLQFRFPFNLLLYASLPVIIPTTIIFALIRFSLQSRSSRARIKELEKADTHDKQTLLNILAELEREVEGAVADFIDDPNPTPIYRSTVPVLEEKAHPILSPQQKKIVAWLNTLPGLKKERAFFPRVSNSHALIISRDVHRFPTHRIGESVIRHWADSLIL